MRIALCFAILVALGSTARAGDDVGVVVDGDSQPQLTAQLADWLTRHGYRPELSPLPPDTVSLFTDVMRVDDQAAGRAILDKHSKTRNTVYVRINIKTKATTGARDVTVTVYWLVNGRDATSQKQDCERCTDQLLRSAIDDVMRKLLGGGAQGHVKLKSSPPKARITIDGQPIGVTPLDWDLPSGKHSIAMDKAGFKTEAREVVIASDKLELVVMTLEPAVASDTTDRPSLAPPIATLVLGAAAIGVGAYLFAIDEDETGDKPTYKDSALAGGVVAAGGAAVAIVGAVWLYKTHQARSQPVAAITRDTAYIGWLGHF